MRRVIGTVAVLVGTLILSGCGDGDPLPTLPPSPSSTPVFASEEEALAAAEAAYEAYWSAVNQITNDGGADPERIAEFVTKDHLAAELESFEGYSDNGLRSTGSAVITNVLLQQYIELEASYSITFYACVDVSPVRIIDTNGYDVTPVDRPSTVALEVSMSGSGGAFLVESSDQWSDSQFCSQ